MAATSNPFSEQHAPLALLAPPPVDLTASAPAHKPAANLIAEDEINGILSHLSVELREKANTLSDHTYNVMELQNKLRSLEQAFAAERAARVSAEASAKQEYERRHAVESRLKMADAAVIELQGRVRVLEDSNKRGYEGYRQLELHNQQLIQQLQALGYDASIMTEELRKEREAKARMDSLLNSIKERGLSPEETIQALEKAAANETDVRFLKLLQDQIGLTRRIQQENEDTYLAYRLQHGEDPAASARQAASKKAQEQADAALALRLQQEERARGGGAGAGVVAASGTVHKQPAMKQGYANIK